MTPKRKQFVIEYTLDFNATQAAIRAGYSERTAYSIGHDLLKIPEIKEAIAERVASLCVGPDEVLTRLGAMARGETPTRITGDTPTYDTHAALQSVGKVHAMFIDKQQIEQLDGLEIIDDDEEG